MMRARFAAIAIVAAAPIIAAQTPPRDPAQLLAPPGTGVVSGVVVDAENKPMRLVAVRIEGDPRASRTVMTDDAGRFTFTRVPPGEFFLRAKKPAYPDASYGAKRPGRAGARLQIKEGTRIEQLVLRMERGAVITGTVLNDRGQPVPDVSVAAYRAYTGLDGGFSTSSFSTPSGYPRTDDRGVFRLYGLPAGEYIIGTSPFFGAGTSARVPTDDEIREAFARAEQGLPPNANAPARAQTPPPPQVDYAPVYFPDAPNAATAARITVAAGEERSGIDLRLVLRPTAAISGQVSNKPDAGSIEMLLVTAAQGTTLHTGALPDGSFNFRGLPAGDYTVAARTAGPNPMLASYDVTLSGRDVSGINLVLAPPISVTGQIVLQHNGTGPAPALSQVRVSALPASIRGGGNPITSSAGPDGTFVLQGMMPGRYQITATIAGVSGSQTPFGLTSVVTGDRDITDAGVDLALSAPLEKVTITLSDSLPELSGRILAADGTPATGYYVVAVAADQRYWIWQGRRIKSARPDAEGRFVFPNLPAGTYRVAATTDLETSDLSDRSFLDQILAASAEVTVLKGEKKVFDLKIGG